MQTDTSRFLSFHSANLSAYEEILAEMAIVETPFTASPPYVQLLTCRVTGDIVPGVTRQQPVLVMFNTAIFIGSALIQRSFSVDILPIVCSMTGASPVEPPRATAAAPAPAPGTGSGASDAFATFARTFG